jgi:hypothetical protein
VRYGLYLCVPYGSHSKQRRLFPQTALTDDFCAVEVTAYVYALLNEHVTPTDPILRHVIRDAAGAHMWPVRVHAVATVARRRTRRSRVSREPQGQEESHQNGCGCGCHIRRLLVSNTGMVQPWLHLFEETALNFLNTVLNLIYRLMSDVIRLVVYTQTA